MEEIPHKLHDVLCLGSFKSNSQADSDFFGFCVAQRIVQMSKYYYYYQVINIIIFIRAVTEDPELGISLSDHEHGPWLPS